MTPLLRVSARCLYTESVCVLMLGANSRTSSSARISGGDEMNTVGVGGIEAAGQESAGMVGDLSSGAIGDSVLAKGCGAATEGGGRGGSTGVIGGGKGVTAGAGDDAAAGRATVVMFGVAA